LASIAVFKLQTFLLIKQLKNRNKRSNVTLHRLAQIKKPAHEVGAG